MLSVKPSLGSNTSCSTNLVPQYSDFQEKAFIVLEKPLRFNVNCNIKGLKKLKTWIYLGKQKSAKTPQEKIQQNKYRIKPPKNQTFTIF